LGAHGKDLGENPSLDDIAGLVAAIEEHGPELIAAAADCGVPPDSISDAYAGEYRDHGELAFDLVESGCFGPMPEGTLSHYIDFDSLGRDLVLGGDYSESGGHYFHGNY
jgi:antirestriction protein